MLLSCSVTGTTHHWASDGDGDGPRSLARLHMPTMMIPSKITKERVFYIPHHRDHAHVPFLLTGVGRANFGQQNSRAGSTIMTTLTTTHLRKLRRKSVSHFHLLLKQQHQSPLPPTVPRCLSFCACSEKILFFFGRAKVTSLRLAPVGPSVRSLAQNTT
jgi:hypothetical protein